MTALLIAPACTTKLRAQTPPAFEVASIKPNNTANRITNVRPPAGGRFSATNANLKTLIGLAYKVQSFEISGGQPWMGVDGFDIEARADSNLTMEQFRPLLQALLAERFQLVAHRETRDEPLYALVVAKNGPKLPAVKDAGCTTFDPNRPPPPPENPAQLPPTPCGAFFVSPNRLEGGRVSMSQLANALTNILGRRVIDKTGIASSFDVKLDFSREGIAIWGPGGFEPSRISADAVNPDAPPSIFTAVQDQLGLKLESQKGPMEIVVVDRAAKPTDN